MGSFLDPGSAPGSMGEADRTAPSFAALAESLALVASEARLELLYGLRTPKGFRDLEVTPEISRGSEDPDRPLSRQAITHHLDQLRDAGLVEQLPTAPGDPHQFVVNHERLFALIDEMRGLAKLRPVAVDQEPADTMQGEPVGEEAGPRRPAGPRLVVAYGRDDGVAFPLDGPPGTRWTVGRAPGCDVRLDYDPYASGRNSIVERLEEGFVVHDLEDNRNGTWVNWDRVPAGGSRDLEAGDVVTVGRTHLVFQG